MNHFRSLTLYGLIGGALHLGMGVLFALYFGLGMSPCGAWFVTNVWSQPGRAIVIALDALGRPGLYSVGLLVNFAVYSFFTALAVWLIRRQARRIDEQ